MKKSKRRDEMIKEVPIPGTKNGFYIPFPRWFIKKMLNSFPLVKPSGVQSLTSREKLMNDMHNDILKMVDFHLKKAITKHGPLLVSRHEGLGMIIEEEKELIDAIHKGKSNDIISESLDVAIAAIWLAHSEKKRVENK